MSLAALGLTEAQQNEIQQKLLLGCSLRVCFKLGAQGKNGVYAVGKALWKQHPLRSLMAMSAPSSAEASAPSSTQAPAPSSAQAGVPAQEAGLADAAAQEAGLADAAATQVDPEIEEIKRSLSAQLEGAAEVSLEVPQESAPQFGRGASILGHAASFTETSGAAMLLKACSYDPGIGMIVASNSSLQTLGPVESSAAAVARPPPTCAPRKSRAAKEDTWAFCQLHPHIHTLYTHATTHMCSRNAYIYMTPPLARAILLCQN